ncbi:MAG TPA: cellulose binding domain-containing protein, partial [Polyangiaceae bacterium]
VCVARNSSSGSPIQASISVNNDWGGGYCAVLNVTNPTPTSFSNWNVEIDTKLATVYTSWSGTLSSASGIVGIAPQAWNASLSPYEKDSSIGFCVNRNVAGDGTVASVLATTAY